jgi:PEP-CTERM motif
MLKKMLAVLTSSSIVSFATAHAATYADSIVAYSQGTGFATEFGSGLGYTNATAALGEPSRVTPGQFGGPVDPFNPPYQRDQLLSIGTGGSLTVGFSSPILNNPANPFGLDLNIFGNTGFAITNGNYTGGGITDGSFLSGNSSTARIFVSADNLTYYQLDPARAPTLGGLFPTDGSGNFALPVDPKLSSANFAGLDLAEIKSLYNGSGGGTGFDISWALDGNGHSVALADVRFIRIDVLSGSVEVDGFAAVEAVPEPAVWVLFGMGLMLMLWTFRKSKPAPAPARSTLDPLAPPASHV